MLAMPQKPSRSLAKPQHPAEQDLRMPMPGLTWLLAQDLNLDAQGARGWTALPLRINLQHQQESTRDSLFDELNRFLERHYQA